MNSILQSLVMFIVCMHIVNCFAFVAVLFDVYVVCYLEIEECPDF